MRDPQPQAPEEGDYAALN